MKPSFLAQFDVARHATELLVIFAADASTATGANAQAQPVLLAEQDEAAQGVLTSGEFRAAANELVLLHSPIGFAAKRLLIVGLGKQPSADANAVRKAAGAAVRYAKARNLREVAILTPGEIAGAERAAIEGALLADFDPDTYRSDRKDTALTSLTILGDDEAGFQTGAVLGESQNWARGLVNEPGNVLNPTELGKRAQAMCAEVSAASSTPVSCEVFSTSKLEELGMGAFLGVAQGSAQPPALIVAKYEPEGAAADVTLGLVGKAITFDTGGISLKPADGMEKMKYDMGGGAAMLGALRSIALLGLKVRVLCVICSAENMPGSRAYRPGDVLRAMSGKTIEVINTDAEGRLVLADGLFYARQLGATHLINAATLTGAVAVALGTHHAGVFTNNDETLAKFNEGLKASGERFWNLPLTGEYTEQIRSHIADIMNTGGRYGGASTAAAFLKEFVDETPWLHLDIASMAWLDEAKAWTAKGPSGVGVRSIVEWAREFNG